MVQRVTIFTTLDYVTRDEIIFCPYNGSLLGRPEPYYCYGLVKDMTLVLGPDELGVLFEATLATREVHM